MSGNSKAVIISQVKKLVLWGMFLLTIGCVILVANHNYQVMCQHDWRPSGSLPPREEIAPTSNFQPYSPIPGLGDPYGPLPRAQSSRDQSPTPIDLGPNGPYGAPPGQYAAK